MAELDGATSEPLVNTRFPRTDGDATTERILAAARSEIFEFGIRRINVMDIARRAGCGRRTLYTRFSDKDQLVSAVLWGEVQTAANRIAADVARADRSADAIEELLVAAIRTIREHPLIDRLIASEPEYLIDLAKSGGIEGARQLVEAYLASLGDIAGERSVAADMVARVVLMSVLARNGVVSIDDDEKVRDFARGYLVPIATGAPRPRTDISASSAALPWLPSLGDQDTSDPVTQRILDAAFEAFSEVGVRQANMVDIARRASCPRTTLYRRFPDKDQLVQAFAQREIARIVQTIDHDLATSHTPADAMIAIAVTLYRLLREHPALRTLVAVDTEELFAQMREGNLLTLARHFIAIYLSSLQTTATPIPGDPQVVADVISRLMFSHLLDSSGPIPIGSDEEVRQFAETYLVPIVTGQARRL